MALPMLAKGIGGSLIKGGRKKKISPQMILPGGGSNGGGKGGALVAKPSASLAPKSVSSSAIVKAPKAKVTSARLSMADILVVIRKDVNFIESFLNFDLTNKTTKLAGLKKDKSKKRLEKEEKISESKLKKPKFGLKLPKSGIVDGVKNFIGNMLMGMFVLKMLDFLKGKNISAILKTAGAAVDFIIGVGGTLLNGLATFIDWGYKAYDATLGFIEKFGGQGAVDNFEKFTGLIDTALFLTTAIAGSMAVEAMTGGGGDGPGILDFMKGKGAAKGATAAATKGTAAGTAAGGGGAAGTAGTVGGVAVGTAAAVIAGVGLLASALGEGAYQIKKIGKKPIDDAQKQFDKYTWFNPMKYFWGAALGMQKMLMFPLTFTGYALDVIGTPFRYAIELIRFGVMALMGDTEGMKKQNTNLAKFDSRIRESIREMLNMLTLGLAFKEKGSFGNIFGDEKAQAEMMKKYAEGGTAKAPGSKSTKKKKSGLRKLPQKPTYTREPVPKSSESLGTTTIINEKAWWDPAGVFTGGESVQEIKASRDVSRRIISVQNKLGDDDYFGPILSLTSKLIRGQRPTFKDYENIGLGLNLLYQEGMKDGVLGGMPTKKYSNGGSVTPEVASEDISKWVQKTFEDKLRNKIQNALTLNVPETVGTKSKKDSSASDGEIPGGASQDEIDRFFENRDAQFGADDSEMTLLQRLVLAESGGEGLLGMSLVARSVLNRAALIQSGKVSPGMFLAKDETITGVIMGSGQYQPISDGSINKSRTESQMSSALQAIDLARDLSKLKEKLKAAGVSDNNIRKLMAATGFRTGSAFNDPSQNVNVVQFKNHYFNTAGNKSLATPGAQISTTPTVSVPQAPSTSAPTASMPGKVKKGGIYLHWSGGNGFDAHSDRYHRTVLADGSVVGDADLNIFDAGAHTAYRNKRGVGLAVAAMLEWNWSTLKPIQLEKLAETAAAVAKSMGYSAADINVKNIATHAEVGSMKDGVRNPAGPNGNPDNYGPTMWGGDSNKLDLLDLNKADYDKGLGQGGPKLRAMILQKFKAMKQGGYIGKYDKSMKSIESFAPYESGAEQIIMVPLPSQGQSMPMMDTQQPNTSLPTTVFADDQFEFLDYQG